MADVKVLAEQLVNLTVKEVNELAKILEDEYGIKPAAAAAPVMMAAAPAAAEVEVQTEFDVVLVAAGDKKLEVVKVVKNITNLGLKEAKDLVDGAPSKIKEKITKEEAEQIKNQLTDADRKSTRLNSSH